MAPLDLRLGFHKVHPLVQGSTWSPNALALFPQTALGSGPQSPFAHFLLLLLWLSGSLGLFQLVFVWTTVLFLGYSLEVLLFYLIFESKTEYLAQYHAINCSRIDLEIPPTVPSNTHLGAAGKEMINLAPRLSATQGEKSRWSIFSGV